LLASPALGFPSAAVATALLPYEGLKLLDGLGENHLFSMDCRDRLAPLREGWTSQDWLRTGYA